MAAIAAKKSGRGRGRRNASSLNAASPLPTSENNVDRIFVWYIDETVLIYLTMAEYNRYLHNVSVPMNLCLSLHVPERDKSNSVLSTQSDCFASFVNALICACLDELTFPVIN